MGILAESADERVKDLRFDEDLSTEGLLRGIPAPGPKGKKSGTAA